MRRFWLMILVALALGASGCSGGGSGGGSGSGSSGSGGFTPPPAVTSTTADVVLNFELARAVPEDVHFRFTGLDAAGTVVWGPEERPRAATITLTLPVTVTRLRIEYLRGDTVVGMAVLSLSLRPDATITIEDPEFEDVAATLTALNLTPDPLSLADGTRGFLTATGTFSDGTTQDLSASVLWASGDEAVATVSNAAGSRGQVTGVAVGTTRVTAALPGFLAGADVEVTPATLDSLAVTPANPVTLPDTTVSLTATGLFSNLATQDLTATAQWTTDDAAVATVDASGVVQALLPGVANITATVGTRTGTARINVTGVPVTGLQITPASPSLAKGTLLQLTATATLQDGTTLDVTSSATWSSTDSGVAPVSPTGRLSGLAVGTSEVSAEFAGEGDTRTATVTAADLVSLAVDPGHAAIGAATQQAYTATGTFSDGTTQDLTATATFAAANPAVATMAGATATGVAAGQTAVTATQGAVSGQATLTVTGAALQSIQVTPPTPTRAKGTTAAFTATGNYADGTAQDLTSQVTWTSSTGAATISNAAGSRGLATAVSTTGSPSTITANLGGVSGTASLTVTAATLVSVAVDPPEPSVGAGAPLAFTATGTFSDGTTQDLTGAASWTSSNPAAATVAGNVATGVATGQADIRATFGGVAGGTRLTVTPASLASITVTPAGASFAKGTTLQYQATGTFSDGTTRDLTSAVSWTSDDPVEVSFNPRPGEAFGAGTGSTAVRATLGGVSGTTTVTVTAATLASVQVDPPHPVVFDGLGQAFTATGTFSDGTTQDLTASATWTSTQTSVATIAAGGAATAVAAGQTTIQAQSGAVTGTTTMTVRDASLTSLTVNPLNPSIAKGTFQQFTATGAFTDGSTADLTTVVTWASSSANATISNAAGTRGRAFGALAGPATISCSLGGVTSNNATLTVTAATLSSLAVAPTAPNVQSGATVNFTATGTFSDGTTQDLTSVSSWTSSTPSAATVNGSGVASAVAAGVTTITATRTGVSAQTNLTVRRASLQSIAVTPANPTLTKGLTRQFTAVGTYADGTTEDLTSQVTWTSGTTSVATISNAAGSKGLASTATATGSSVITATLGAVSGTTTLTVSAATLQSLAVTPRASSIVDGTTQTFTATGTFSDGSTQNLTGTASWTSSDTTVATMAANVATGANAGATTIRATIGAVQGQTTLTVRNASLVSIAVTPGTASIQVTASQQFLATGTYSDGSTLNITSLVTWASSATGVATISNLADAKGLALGLLTGSTNITATLSGVVSPNAVLTVVGAIAPAVPLGVDGNPPNGHSSRPDIANVSGSALTFYGSGATNLVASDTNGIDDAFASHSGATVRVLTNGTTQPSIAFPPGPLSDRFRVAQGGGFVLYNTLLPLEAGDTNTNTSLAEGIDVYRVPVTFPGGVLTLGTPVRASETAAGAQATKNCAFGDLSADGRYVVFDSSESTFGVSGGSRQVFRKDMDTGTLSLVSLVDGSASHGNGLCRLPRVSNDGRYVVWVASSSVTNLVQAGDLGGADTNGFSDIYVRDTTNNTTTRVSLTDSDAQSTLSDDPFPIGSFGNCDISGNGQFVCFPSDGKDLVTGDTNGRTDAFVRDIVNNTTERVSLADDESEGTCTGITSPLGVTEAGSISANGRWVVFVTDMNNLDPTSADTNGVTDVFVRDRTTGQTRRVSLGPDRSQGLQTCGTAGISDDGFWITFTTASPLVPTDTNGFVDVYVVANPLFQ